MTAIIAILNKNGVSIAADRAGSVMNGKTMKVYDSNKLFRLSAYEPLGIATYQNSEFMGIPWEIIIKEYKKHLGDKSFHEIEGYKKDFLEYLSSLPVNDRFHEEYLIKIVFKYIWERLKEKIKKLPIGKKNIPHSEIKSITEINITNLLNEITELSKKTTSNININEDDIKEVLKIFNKTITTQINELFGQMGLTANSITKIKEILKLEIKYNILGYLNLGKFNLQYPYSGIIITGYGDNKLFPSLTELKIFTKFNSKIRYIEGRKAEIDDKIPSTIIPFAQEDVVKGIIEGFNPIVESDITNNFKQYIDGIPGTDEAQKAKILSGYLSAINISKQRYSYNLISAIKFFPLSDLGETAETLINLTSFKRRVTMEDETVGGDTDVAIISKSDGFIWSKRKHYFNKDLNHQYFKNNY